jgi:formate hydrogenlyase subunit 3/multisubunit Na+/H+ antiporter MnhD subunit
MLRRRRIKLHIDDILLNPHWYGFLFVLIIGFAITVLAGYHYRNRTEVIVISVYDISKYNRREKNFFYSGVLLTVIALVGLYVSANVIGLYVKYTDSNGIVSIKKESLSGKPIP